MFTFLKFFWEPLLFGLFVCETAHCTENVSGLHLPNIISTPFSLSNPNNFAQSLIGFQNPSLSSRSTPAARDRKACTCRQDLGFCRFSTCGRPRSFPSLPPFSCACRSAPLPTPKRLVPGRERIKRVERVGLALESAEICLMFHVSFVIGKPQLLSLN